MIGYLEGRLKRLDASTALIVANGVGAYANSLLEYSLNGQFKRFTAKVGIDAAKEHGSLALCTGRKADAAGVVQLSNERSQVDSRH